LAERRPRYLRGVADGDAARRSGLPRELLLGLGGAVWLSTAVWVTTFPVSFTHTG